MGFECFILVTAEALAEAEIRLTPTGPVDRAHVHLISHFLMVDNPTRGASPAATRSPRCLSFVVCFDADQSGPRRAD